MGWGQDGFSDVFGVGNESEEGISPSDWATADTGTKGKEIVNGRKILNKLAPSKDRQIMRNLLDCLLFKIHSWQFGSMCVYRKD